MRCDRCWLLVNGLGGTAIGAPPNRHRHVCRDGNRLRIRHHGPVSCEMNSFEDQIRLAVRGAAIVDDLGDRAAVGVVCPDPVKGVRSGTNTSHELAGGHRRIAMAGELGSEPGFDCRPGKQFWALFLLL